MEIISMNGTFIKGSTTPGNLNIETSLECPFCHKGIEHKPVTFIKNNDKKDIQIFMKCLTCSNAFIGYATRLPEHHQDTYTISKLSKGNHKTKLFDKVINNISENFIKIYGEAEFAEQEGLNEVCGIGYRKALEFLIKDYAISLQPEEIEEKTDSDSKPKTDKIKDMPLSQCINKYIEDKKIQEISKRAVWIGNDETHYIKKWENKDLSDLKKLIDITIHFIIMDVEANEYIKSMDK